MADNIISAAEAATVLRTDATDPNIAFLLPQIDAFIENATGRKWESDETVRPEAKAAARMLLVMWFENPAMIGNTNVLSFGLTAALVQLEAIALELVEEEAES